MPGVSDLDSLCSVCFSSVCESLGNCNAFPDLWEGTPYSGAQCSWDGLLAEWPAMVRGLCITTSSSPWGVRFLKP